MAHERLLDRNIQPDRDLIHKTIGKEVLPVWEQVEAFLTDAYPAYAPEPVFYNPQHGWAIRYRKDAQQLCWLFPERGAFTALITLDPDEDEQALEKIDFFNARIRELLNQFSPLPEGRWLWVRFQDHTDFVGFKILLEIKKT